MHLKKKPQSTIWPASTDHSSLSPSTGPSTCQTSDIRYPVRRWINTCRGGRSQAALLPEATPCLTSDQWLANAAGHVMNGNRVAPFSTSQGGGRHVSMYTMPMWTGRDIHEDTHEDDTGVKREHSDYGAQGSRGKVRMSRGKWPLASRPQRLCEDRTWVFTGTGHLGQRSGARHG